jgi:hypothetical protein
MKTLGLVFIYSLLLSALAQVEYKSYLSGSFQYDIASPEETVYNVHTVPLNISIRTTNGLRFGYNNYVTEIFYCLDGKKNVSVHFTETVTSGGAHHYYRALTDLSSLADGDHNIAIYAIGKSYPFVLDSIDFANRYSLKTTVTQSTYFSTALVIASVTTVVVVGVGLLIYFKKCKH